MTARRRVATLAAVATVFAAATAIRAAADPDPYLWLEEVDGARALQWARAETARSRALLEAGKGFASYRERASAILNDRGRLALPRAAGNDVLNLWQDRDHVRGLWRASDVRAFAAGAPAWRTMIDLDALARAEGRNWVWRSATCLPPAYRRCMVALSDGGRDAVTWREFDRAVPGFVVGGFVLPEAKADVAWQDEDHLLVVSDFGRGTLNASGYGRQLRRLARGGTPAAAPILYEAPAGDVWLRPTVARGGGVARVAILRNLTTWRAEVLELDGDRAKPTPIPTDAAFQTVIGDRVIAQLQSPLKRAGTQLPAGALVGYRLGGGGALERVFVPARGETVSSVAATRSTLYVGLLHDVAARLVALDATRRWQARAIPLPPAAALSFADAQADGATLYYVTQGLTRPEELHALDDGGQPRRIAALPARFDASRLSVAQHWTRSADGTRIPYFVVRPKDAVGPIPTVIQAYGGFRQPLLPTYLSALAQLWVEGGNAYVIANVRGGGEFGPAWHAAALGPGRQRSYDDVHAVAEALKFGRSASRVGIYGVSNGGLLAAAVMLQRPGLYDAAVIASPLTDMKRYAKLLAGASWMAEYGDPDRAADWDWLRRYSPYHNVARDAVYPRPFILTSTKDDRVHPGHARKLAARLQEQGHAFYYHENIDGGHAGAANRVEQADRTALILSYLDRELGRKPTPPVPAPSVAYLHAQQLDLLRRVSADGWHATADGLRYRVVRAGRADAPRPSPGSTVTVHYVGRFIDGRTFDSSRDRGTPATFPVAGVVRGWREALPMMRTGEIWEIALPASLAYGPLGRGEIPGGATLVFEIELIAITCSAPGCPGDVGKPDPVRRGSHEALCQHIRRDRHIVPPIARTVSKPPPCQRPDTM